MKRFLMILAAVLTPLLVSAQEIRYVSTQGDNTKNGQSWADAKADIQDAINDLVNNNLKGEVWVAEGTYYPTETAGGNGELYRSFKIPAGITVRGGFAGTETTADQRAKEDDTTFGKASSQGDLDGESHKGGVYTHKTVLSGNLVKGKKAQFQWNEKKQRFDTQFYGNSYHVVWFAMNGFTAGRANPLPQAAKLEGCVIEGGHAYNNDVNLEHPHEAYGGGIYMVLNSFVYNCEVRHCDASRDGGGIYQDGGGIVRRTYVHDCQALGLGVEHGYGGGICQAGSNGQVFKNEKTAPVVVAQSAITNCVGRMGGGLALKVSEEDNSRFTVVANSSLVNNNTAITEGGGVYTLGGGGVASLTIVGNKCNGTGVTLNGMPTGRAGGLYCRDFADVGNNVIWGNECEANADIQFASTRSSVTYADGLNKKVNFQHNALSKSDNTDWSSTFKLGVVPLDDQNNTEGDKGAYGYPLFENPLLSAGNKSKAGYAEEYFVKDSEGNTTSKTNYRWKIYTESALYHMGIQTIDLDVYGRTPAPEYSSDMTFGLFNPRCNIGAFVSESTPIVANLSTNGEAHFFVDPGYVYTKHEEAEQNRGNNWDTPARFLGNVFEAIDDDRNGSNTLAERKIFIHVKQGTVDNTDSKSSGRVRNLSLRVPAHVSILGSYDSSLTGTNLDKRSVVSTPTIIDGSLLEDYDYAVAHLVVINGKEDVTLDGFRISYANATSTKLGSADQNGIDKQSGAALTIVNSTDVQIKNIMVSNCQASKGAAVYADNSTVSFDNCILHNNTSSTIQGSGLVYGTNGSHLTFDHCDALRNVGHVSYLGSNNTDNKWTNSIFYGNMNRSMENTNEDAGGGIDNAVAAFSGATTKATGSRCMFDAKSAQFAEQFGGNDTGNPWQYNLQYRFAGGNADGYPRFINPTSNAGVSTEGDMTYYGRSISFEPHNSNPIVNAASADEDHSSWGVDIEGTSRDFGGLPDIGAVENHKNTTPGEENAYSDGQPAYGTLYYVRTYEDLSQGGDGTSWEKAINGNAYYLMQTGEFLGATTEKKITWTETVEDYVDVISTSATTSPTYSSIANPSLFKMKNNATGKYLKVDGSNVLQVIEAADGDNFIAIGNNNGAEFYSITAQRYINYANTSSVTVGTSGSTNKWTVKDGKIYRSVKQGKNTTTYYWRLSDANATLALSSTNSNNVWNYYAVTHQKTGETHEEQKTETVKGIKGLQFAVNMANKAYQQSDVPKQVWVAAGIYAKDPEQGDESCFIIKDGVNVYGAFPKVGNPGMNERQALVSQYVKNNGTYSADDYETILEPTTKTIESGVSRRVLGQPWENNPRSWEGTTNTNNYKGAEWNGFTLRFGCTEVKGRQSGIAGFGGRDGGGGACLYNNVKLVDCVVTHNTSLRNDEKITQDNLRAGGVYMDGGTMASCYIINNLLEGRVNNTTAYSAAAYGGGAYMYNGTMYNCVVANNRIHGNFADGAGLYFENATFFNNTVVNNKAEGNSSAIGGIALYTDLSKVSGDISLFNIYNSIILNNEGWKAASNPASHGHKNVGMRTQSGKMYLHNCITSDLTNVNVITEANKKENVINYDANCQQLDDNQIGSILENIPTGYVDPSTTSETFDTWNLRLKSTAAKCINMGEDNPTLYGVTYDLSEYNDMDYAERIQDCRIDIGAYEFNGSMSIAPQVTGDVATYYVTPEGYGSTNADSPANAACASKLQRVIDAAGRYKFQHPEKQVIVKIANSHDLQHAAEPSHFTYYATRTTDYADDNARVWSIIIPRGVEVWGGYTDKNADNTPWTNDKNGFQTRDITAHPTYFDSYYVNKLEHASVNTYHVVTFTDLVFDPDGMPYSKDDTDLVATGGKSTAVAGADHSNESNLLHMNERVSGNVIMENGDAKNFGSEDAPRYASNRAVLDGIFVSGGQADAIATGQNTQLNINQYGGAAIVTDYAYVRNCILTGNTAKNGGALALTHEALVSGSLIMQNEATNHGGGLYFFEDGKTLSNGTKIKSKQSDGGTIDQHMAHVLTSTIVNNTAKQGGGVWFANDANANARLNSCVIWQNAANDQPNVYGNYSPEQSEGDQHNSEEFYPFAYSAIQDLRVAGTNNVSMAPANEGGIRFVDKDYDINASVPNLDKTAKEAASTDLVEKYANFGYFGLTNYSFLANAGMPIAYYKMIQKQIALADDDLLGMDRLYSTSKVKRDFIEIGARAIDKTLPDKQLMLRLFVARPDNINLDMANKMIDLKSSSAQGSEEEYYSQEGSSFAYPMQTLQEALDYIKMWRSDVDLINQAHANNLPFEILVARGTYYPKQDLNGNTENALGATFAIPEGVTIIGGFDAQGGNGTYYGRYYEPDGTKAQNMTDGSSILGNVKAVAKAGQNIMVGDVTFQLWNTPDICSRRALADINANDIIEPWEFKNQTILSGDATATHELNHGVYHIITIVPDQNAVGYLPKMQKQLSEHNDATCTGYASHELGQTVTLNGIIVQGGHAMDYVENALDEYGRYIYYQGGGINVDGNRYCNDYNTKNRGNGTPGETTVYDQKHRSAYGVGYRDIPLTIVNCRFNNNIAGYGGAITSNGTLYTYNSSFEQNIAKFKNETNLHYIDDEGTEHTNGVSCYPGTGGAIMALSKISCINTIFANNEAQSPGLELEPQTHPSFRVPVPDPTKAFKSLRGAAGAILVGVGGDFHIVNCNFVRNKANLFPAIYSLNPTLIPTGSKSTITTPEYSQLVNTVAWGNEVTPEMLTKYAGNEQFKFTAKFAVNPGKKDRTRDLTTPEHVLNTVAQVANYSNWPRQLSDVDEAKGIESSLWQDPAVYSAYEEGCGFVTHNEKDARLMPHNSPEGSGGYQISQFLNGYYQNCNLTIASENGVLEGPNFVNPSHRAGVDGYMESADWSPARINNLTDNGSGMIRQTITNDGGKDYTCTFNKYTSQPQRSVDGFTMEQAGDYDNVGVYTTLHYYSASKDYQLYMPVGEDLYMRSTTENETASLNGVPIERQKNLPRVSYDPNPTHDQTFIDIGVYEYQHIRLNPTGDEVDVLWVSNKEKPEHGAADGSCWEQPTSDMQRAIETLLASRNGKRKEIRVMEGTYTPTYSFIEKVSDGQGGEKEEKFLSFYINTKELNKNTILAYDGESPKLWEGVVSLTIKGGYSKDLKEIYDPKLYPTIIQQQKSESANTDHLFYISDATQRYGYNDHSSESANHYSEDNAWGALPHSGSAQAKSLPIEFDGLTIINDKIDNPNTQGAAIYYADYTGEGTHLPIVPTAATITDSYDASNPADIQMTTTTLNEPAKLIISKCHILGSGKESDKSGSAVYLGAHGGTSLIYNTVFHSNKGMPLVTRTAAATVNNTFALNGNLADLADGSTVKNSVLWRNNAQGEQYGEQLHINGSMPVLTGEQSVFLRNAFTGGNTTSTNYGGADAEDNTIYLNHYNVGLADSNADLINGPNFINPEATDLLSRSFELKPSLRLLNRGNNALYKQTVEHFNYSEGDPLYDLAMEPTIGLDAIGMPRVKATTIDLGAIEYQYELESVLYVDPNKTASENAHGRDWSNPLGYGSVQDAIDLVAIAHQNNPEQPSYVFVKGASSTNQDLKTNETLTLRDGVTIYGSIKSDYTSCAADKKTDGTAQFPTMDDYIQDLKKYREGVASTASNKTVVEGIKVNTQTAFRTPALIDGFVVTNSKPATEPVLNIDNNSNDQNTAIVMRNIIVADNDLSSATAGTPVAFINNALLYEALFRNNKTNSNAAVLKLGKTTNTAGYAVNVTVEGKTLAADGSAPVDGGKGSETNIWNSITNSIGTNFDGAEARAISGYFYQIDDPNLNYQLTETSKYIDDASCVEVSGMNLPEKFRPYINYTEDRDLLGNPRQLKAVTTGGTVDRGAFETWRIDNDFVCGVNGTLKDDASLRENILQQYFPHDGSVVYVMKNRNLVIDPIDGTDLNATPENPGFLLLKQGASFYGNGRPVTAAYVAIERNMPTTGAIVSVPYAMNYKAGIATVSTNDKGELVLNSEAPQQLRQYSGTKRAEANYVFQPANSPCWEVVADDEPMAANYGVFVQPHDGAAKDAVYRFTAKGSRINDYIYTETGNSKVVDLINYDDILSTNGAADFTDDDDMSWNCIGLPYLVSEYRTYELADATAHQASDDMLMMEHPNTMWLYYNGVKSPDGSLVNGNGGYYSVDSWADTNEAWHVSNEAEKSIWVGEGIFMQTATLFGSEPLTFYRPLPPTSSDTRARRQVRYYMGETNIEHSESDATLLRSEYYTADGVRVSKPRHAAVVIRRDIYSDGSIRTRKMTMN